VTNLLLFPISWQAMGQGASRTLAQIDETFGVSRSVKWAFGEVDDALGVRLAGLALGAMRPHLILTWNMGIPIPIWIPSGAKRRQLNTLSDRQAAIYQIRVSPK